MAVLAGTLATLESQGLTERSLGRARWAVARELTVAGATSPELAERDGRRGRGARGARRG
jgi:hypothetical protein